VNRSTYERTVELPGGERATLYVVGDDEGAEVSAAVDELIAAARHERTHVRRLRDAACSIARLGLAAEARARVLAILIEDADLDELDRSLLRGFLDDLDQAGGSGA
jgi:hypothetical protein